MSRFKVIERESTLGTGPRFAVVDSQNNDLPVAEFATREAAQAHADRLAQGPFDWDEQEAWKDDWDDEDG
ncbi:MAG TPA: hypothetical protein VGA36_10795 [Nitriliruptorales bacterium]